MSDNEEPVTPVELARDARNASRSAKRVGVVAAVYVCVMVTVALYLIWDQGQTIAGCTTRGRDCYEDTRRSSLEFRKALQGDIAELKASLLEATNCIIEQLAEHRDSNETAHRINAMKHGYVYEPPPGEVPPPIPAQLKAACDEFLPPSQGGTKTP